MEAKYQSGETPMVGDVVECINDQFTGTIDWVTRFGDVNRVLEVNNKEWLTIDKKNKVGNDHRVLARWFKLVRRAEPVTPRPEHFSAAGPSPWNASDVKPGHRYPDKMVDPTAAMYTAAKFIWRNRRVIRKGASPVEHIAKAIGLCVCPELAAKDAEIERLKRANAILEKKNKSSLANNLCPDHRDKQAGELCLACKCETLKRERDTFRDAQIALGQGVGRLSAEKESQAAEIERIAADRDYYKDKLRERDAHCAKMLRALNVIEMWVGQFPASGMTWPDGQAMSYGAAYGSSGERDYMRSVAREAILATNAGRDFLAEHERLKAEVAELRKQLLSAKAQAENWKRVVGGDAERKQLNTAELAAREGA